VIVVSESVGSILSRAGKVAGAAAPVIGLAGAFAASQQNPNMSSMEFMYRAAGEYEFAVAAGFLPPPSPMY
jgi:hypothetical protein